MAEALNRIWFDTEFIEDGVTIDIISIGMVREDGAELYLESSDCKTEHASEWVKTNVLPHLQGGYRLANRSEIADAIKYFAGSNPEFWAYYADYDWVALCQLFGTMMDLPKGWPMYCRDIKQLADSLGNPALPQQGKGEHHALADAKWNRDAWRFLQSLSGSKAEGMQEAARICDQRAAKKGKDDECVNEAELCAALIRAAAALPDSQGDAHLTGALSGEAKL